MAKFLRTFYCKECKVSAELDEITKGVTAVECPKCKIVECFGDGDYIDEPMEWFTFIDQAMGLC